MFVKNLFYNLQYNLHCYISNVIFFFLQNIPKSNIIVITNFVFGQSIFVESIFITKM